LQAEVGIRDFHVTGVQTCALPISEEDALRAPDLVERCRTEGGWAGLLTALHRDGRPVRLMARITTVVAPRGEASLLVLLSELTGIGRAPCREARVTLAMRYDI